MGEKRGKAGREGGKDEGTKKAEPVRARLGVGRGVGSVPVESAVGSDSPRVNGGRWNGPNLARQDECLVGCGLG